MCPNISVVINTLNEEQNLPHALGSVRSWADEIVVVDMYSDDRTVEIAREFGAKVFLHERLGFADPARAYANEQASGDWILSLDADEMVPLPLSKELIRIAAAGTADVVRVPFSSYWFGTPLMHTGLGPRREWHYRFFRKGYLEAVPTVHNNLHPKSGSRITGIKYQPGLAILHFAYLDSKDFLEKLDRYTDIEARQAVERGERVTFAGVAYRAIKELGSRYVKGAGFLDGWRGAYITLLYTFYRIVSAGKLYELDSLGGRAAIEARYCREAECILKAYNCEPAASPDAVRDAYLDHAR